MFYKANVLQGLHFITLKQNSFCFNYGKFSFYGFSRIIGCIISLDIALTIDFRVLTIGVFKKCHQLKSNLSVVIKLIFKMPITVT